MQIKSGGDFPPLNFKKNHRQKHLKLLGSKKITFILIHTTSLVHFMLMIMKSNHKMLQQQLVVQKSDKQDHIHRLIGQRYLIMNNFTW